MVNTITVERFTLERVNLNTIDHVDEYIAQRLKKDLRIADHVDAYEFRKSFYGFGKSERQTMRCPATWWQHLKLAVRQRWPRLFGRIAVQFDSASIDCGALVTGLNDTLKDIGGQHYVIPFSSPESRWSYLDDPNRSDDE